MELMDSVPITGAWCLCVSDKTAGKLTDLFANWLLHHPWFPNTEKLCHIKIQTEGAWMPACSSCAKFCLWSFFKNDICKLCIKCLFFKKRILEQKVFSFHKVLWWFGWVFFSSYLYFFGVSLFFLAPWCVLVEKKIRLQMPSLPRVALDMQICLE